jgi:transcriptional regulator with XRE-family HTH domain
MDLEVAFGKVLKSRREGRGLTQSGLADLCELDRTFISLLERGERQPSLRTIFALAEALEVSPEDLVRDTRQCV